MTTDAVQPDEEHTQRTIDANEKKIRREILRDWTHAKEHATGANPKPRLARPALDKFKQQYAALAQVVDNSLKQHIDKEEDYDPMYEAWLVEEVKFATAIADLEDKVVDLERDVQTRSPEMQAQDALIKSAKDIINKKLKKYQDAVKKELATGQVQEILNQTQRIAMDLDNDLFTLYKGKIGLVPTKQHEYYEEYSTFKTDTIDAIDDLQFKLASFTTSTPNSSMQGVRHQQRVANKF